MNFPSPIVYPDPTLYPNFAAPATEGRKVSLGGFVLGDTDGQGVEWTISKFDGWGSPQSTVQFVQRGRSPGSTASEPFLTGRVMTIEGLVKAPSLAALDDAFYRLSAAVTLNQFQMVVAEAAGVKQVAAQRQGEVIPTYLSNRVGKYSILITAKDPLKYGDPVSPWVRLPSSSGGLTWPLAFPITFTGVQAGGTLHVPNAGDEPAPLFARVDGVIPPGGFAVTKLATGEIFGMSLGLAAAEFVTVDMQRREVLAQGTTSRNSFVDRRGFFQVDPGGNDFAFSANVFSSSAKLTLTSSPAWS